jgi:hypothetical protein
LEIRDKTVMVLGGYGEVGIAISRQLLLYSPKELIVTSLQETEAQAAVEELSREAVGSCKLMSFHGNLFVRWSLKDIPPWKLSASPENQRRVVDDNLSGLTKEILTSSTLYKVIVEYRPEIIVDCINTATALAYQNIYHCYKETCQGQHSSTDAGEQMNSLYRLLSTVAIPSLVRHIQILYAAMKEAGTMLYLKVGTTGTGGMGLNIPFTHGEESPSRVLMSKTALGGAHTMLLYTLKSIPDWPIIKEIKPAAMIGWKGISTGEVLKGGKPLPLYDCPYEKAFRLSPGSVFNYKKSKGGVSLEGGKIRGVYIDTGENGVFSLDEFKLITALGLMEFVTPEEIAQIALLEIQGISTGKDVISALRAAVMDPTYRAGFLREKAVKHMERFGHEGVSYGFLGPRVVKLIFEAYLLKQCYGTMADVLEHSPDQISASLDSWMRKGQNRPTEAISLGVPVLLPDEERILFAHRGVADKEWEEDPWIVTPENVDKWASQEWIDLRPKNMATWRDRFKKIVQEDEKCVGDTSSKVDRGHYFWARDEKNNILIDPGEVIAWIFIEEYGGGRTHAYVAPGKHAYVPPGG